MIYLGIGSNLGRRVTNIEKAKYHLYLNGINIIKTSSYYETLSWPDPKKPKFLNIAMEIRTSLSPLKLLDTCKQIEKNLGRKKTIRNSPRICDIDILDYNKKCLDKGIILPHPRMHSRNFVLFPLFEINKDWFHPILKNPIKRLILLLSNRDITSIKQI